MLVAMLQAQMQFATSVLDFSTEYRPSDADCSLGWSACKILGEPDVYPFAGDSSNAWSPSTSSSAREFIVVGFAQAEPIEAVYVYETYYPGAVDTVYLRNANTGIWQPVWNNPAVSTNGTFARILAVTFPMTTYPVDAVRIALNSPDANGYNEIDAVAIGANITSVADIDRPHALRVFPNPTVSFFTVDAGDALIRWVEVRNAAGQQVYQGTVGRNAAVIDIALLPGIYMVHVFGDGFTTETRLVVE